MKRWFLVTILATSIVACRANNGSSDSEVLDATTGQDTWQYKRFSQWLDILEKVLKSADGDEEVAARAIVNGLSRIAAFNLQALGKLYSKNDPAFDNLRDDYKDLEDAIGKWDMWNNVNDSNKRQEAHENLKKLLKKKDWVKKNFKKSRLRDHDEFLKTYAWKSYKKDKEEIVSQLHEQVEAIMSKSYDMALLEDEDNAGVTTHGVHELRRELRWFLIETRVLNGLVRFKEDDQKCPIDFYKDLPKTYNGDPKYTTLPENEPKDKTCRISRCLFIAVNKHVETLGKVKDGSEKDPVARQTNRVPQNLLASATEVFDEIAKTELMHEIGKELKKCID